MNLPLEAVLLEIYGETLVANADPRTDARSDIQCLCYRWCSHSRNGSAVGLL